MIHLSLFSGIGGAELAAEWAGWKNYMSCEISPFCQKVLKYYWPDAYHHTDIHTLNYETINTELTARFGNWRTEPVIITGGFPCQAFSMAGRRKGTEDDRYLWPQMRRIIQEVKPEWVVAENVFGLITWDGGVVFHTVLSDLEAEGYEVQSYVLPAVSVNAPHRRDRVWIVAHLANSTGIGLLQREQGDNRPCEDGTSNRFGEVHSERVTTDSKCIRRGGGSETTRPNQAERIGGMDEDCGRNRSDLRSETSGCGGIIADSEGSSIEGKLFKRQGKRKPGGCDSKNGTTPDTDPTGCTDRTGQHRRQSAQGGTGECGVSGCGIGAVADPCDKGLQGGTNNRIIGECGEKSHEQPSRFLCTDWQNFPTVSPVCERNDELSFGLASITFSKWRIEGIKSMGNAIVPKVIFQIFKTINKYNEITD